MRQIPTTYLISDKKTIDNPLNFDFTKNNTDYDLYYKKIETLKHLLISKILFCCESELNDFKDYLKSYSTETIRDINYYCIEFLLIGVLFKEYKYYLNNLNLKHYHLYTTLNKLRSTKLKPPIDILRGKINTKLYSKKEIKPTPLNLDNFSLLIKWLDSSDDFKEEVIRLKNWQDFLNKKDDLYTDILLNKCCSLTTYLHKIGNDNLKAYLSNLDLYLKRYKKDHLYKEDFIYCGKTEIQYYFNMICSEIMNDIFRYDFLKTNKKIIFAPSCMCQTQNPCKSVFTPYGKVCKSCSKKCNINRISRLGDKYDFKVYIIKHETSLSSLNVKDNSNIGIIGIACISNLISGGFKALRLGFVPQCIPLDYCGCKNHWQTPPLMTRINENKILYILNK